MTKPAEKKKAADGGLVIPCKSEDFIRTLLEVLRPVHKLTKTEMNVAASIIQKYFHLMDTVKDKRLVYKILFQRETKQEIADNSNITFGHFKMVLHRLREQGIIMENSINPTYLPRWEPGKPFRWLFIFKNEL